MQMKATQTANDASGYITPASFVVNQTDDGIVTVTLTGNWTLRGMVHNADVLSDKLMPYWRDPETHWDLCQVELLDSAGAFFLWRASKGKPPLHLKEKPEHRALIRRWVTRQIPENPDTVAKPIQLLPVVLPGIRAVISHVHDFIALIGQFVLDFIYLALHPQQIPLREISATIYRTGVNALGITALVGFLIGIVVSYLSALQLKAFGAQAFIVNILGLSIIRELGPMLAAILVAGRSGSSMAARLGVMRITQELDAMDSMGISQSQRLVLPKIIALVIALPLLVIWTDTAALLGGMLSAKLEVGIHFRQFIELLPTVVPVVNFGIGIGKGAVFGFVIAAIGCHFGLRIKPNTESLATETTSSVVVAITLVIVADAIFAIIFQGVGLP